MMQPTNNLEGIGSIQGIGTTLGVGGGIGDNAVDVTYSTKPSNQNINIGTGVFASTSNGYNLGINQNTGLGVGGAMGSIMGVGGGVQDNAVDVTYSTKPNALVGTGGYATTSAFSVGQGTTGSIMGVGGGVQDSAVDVTYSTKQNNYPAGPDMLP